MPESKLTHFNHPHRETTACSRRLRLSLVKWTTDPKDVDCDGCRHTRVFKEAAK